jgi:hypothetical protein
VDTRIKRSKLFAIMSFYFFIKSSDSKKYYPNNSAKDFTVELEHTLALTGRFAIALIDYSGLGAVSLCCDLCTDSHANDGQKPVLRTLPDSNEYEFRRPIYIPIKSNLIQRIRIYIDESDTLNSSFVDRTFRCTLHLRKISP